MTQFVEIPGFPGYEWNGEICRNMKTKKPKNRKAKNGKYQLINTEGKNLDRSPEELDALTQAHKKQAPKKKAAPAKKERPKKQPSMLFRVNLAHHLGKSNKDIAEEFDITVKRVVDYTWHYKNRGYKAKIEKYLNDNA